MGAADVIPFMPVRRVSMDDCVALARDFGRELAETLDVPVYLYDRAALTPDRASLADGPQGGVRRTPRGGGPWRTAARLRAA